MKRGAVLKEEGMARASAGVSDEWKLKAFDAVVATAKVRTKGFTSNDVWKRLDEPETGSKRALGPVMRRVWRAGLITPTESFRHAENPAQHCQPLRVWKASSWLTPGR